MLIIRDKQMRALGQAREKAFMKRAVRHLTDAFPKKCGDLGEPAVTRSALSGMNAAKRYGLELEVEILRYLNLTYIFGFDFDGLPWASEILTDTELSGESKIEELMEAAFEAEAAMAEETAHG